MFREHITVLIIVFFAASAIFLTGCKKEDDSPVASTTTVLGNGNVTVTGHGLLNKNFNFSLSMGLYNSTSNFTEVLCYTAGSDSLLFKLSFPGISNGIYKWSEGSSRKAFLYLYSANRSYLSFSNGETQITKVEAVTGKIEGTFSGYLVNSLHADSISVSGSFSALRYTDTSKK